MKGTRSDTTAFIKKNQTTALKSELSIQQHEREEPRAINLCNLFVIKSHPEVWDVAALSDQLVAASTCNQSQTANEISAILKRRHLVTVVLF